MEYAFQMGVVSKMEYVLCKNMQQEYVCQIGVCIKENAIQMDMHLRWGMYSGQEYFRLEYVLQIEEICQLTPGMIK